jgi:hypothetical protein
MLDRDQQVLGKSGGKIIFLLGIPALVETNQWLYISEWSSSSILDLIDPCLRS